MEDYKYRITISGEDKIQKIELEDDNAMVVIKTPTWVQQLPLCNLLRVLHEDMNKEGIYIREFPL